MDSVYLTQAQIEDAIRDVLLMYYGIDEAAQDAYERVRISWPTYSGSGSQPGWDRSKDTCFIQVTPDPSDTFGDMNDTWHVYDEETDTQHEIVTYHRRHNVLLIFYGPSAPEDADLFRVSLLRPKQRAFLMARGLAPLPHIPKPRRMPELDGGQWWERWDLTISMYERVSLAFEDDFYTSIRINPPMTDTP